MSTKLKSPITKKKTQPKSVVTHSALCAPYSWTCTCKNFFYRGSKLTPAQCKHVCGVVFTLNGNHNSLIKLGYKPSWAIEEGPLGRPIVVDGVPAREWVVDSASTSETYSVIRMKEE
jgi:hypothetical protein